MSGDAKNDIIDLFAEDSDEDEDLFKETKPIFAKKRKSPDSVVDSSTAACFFPPDAAAEDQKPAAVVSSLTTATTTTQQHHQAYLGFFQSRVVGAQHWKEDANRGDKVLLRQEPTNVRSYYSVNEYFVLCLFVLFQWTLFADERISECRCLIRKPCRC